MSTVKAAHAWCSTGLYVYVWSGSHCGAEGRVDYIDEKGERALVDFGGGRRGGLTWVPIECLRAR